MGGAISYLAVTGFGGSIPTFVSIEVIILSIYVAILLLIGICKTFEGPLCAFARRQVAHREATSPKKERYKQIDDHSSSIQHESMLKNRAKVTGLDWSDEESFRGRTRPHNKNAYRQGSDNGSHDSLNKEKQYLDSLTDQLR